MGPGELAEWIAYYAVEPFGPPVDDQRAAQMCHLMFAANFKGDAPTFFDRVPEETARRERIEAAKNALTVEDKIAAFFNRMIASE